MPDELEQEVVRHELNHHLNRHEEDQSYGTVVIVAGALIAAASEPVGSSILRLIGGLGILGGMVWMLHDVFIRDEKAANEDVDLQGAYEESVGEYDRSRLETGFEKLAGICLLLPGNIHGTFKGLYRYFSEDLAEKTTDGDSGWKK